MNNKEKYFLTKLARRGRKTNIVEPPVQVELEDPTPPTVELPEAPDNSDWPTSEKFPHPADKIPEWMKKVRLGPGGPHNKKPSPPPKNKYGPFENFRLGPGGPHNKKSSKQAGAL